jgi:hypothetical protein
VRGKPTHRSRERALAAGPNGAVLDQLIMFGCEQVGDGIVLGACRSQV